MIVYAADWVLPVEGTPIPFGGVAVADGRITGVGPADELEGEVRRFPDAAIVPGFVNAHTHLEYAVYAGFGDGLPFGPWLHTHMERKARIGWDEFLAIARLGAAESLASGVTTIGDASFSGAAATASAMALKVRSVRPAIGRTNPRSITTAHAANGTPDTSASARLHHTAQMIGLSR